MEKKRREGVKQKQGSQLETLFLPYQPILLIFPTLLILNLATFSPFAHLSFVIGIYFYLSRMSRCPLTRFFNQQLG